MEEGLGKAGLQHRLWIIVEALLDLLVAPFCRAIAEHMNTKIKLKFQKINCEDVKVYDALNYAEKKLCVGEEGRERGERERIRIIKQMLERGVSR